MSWDLVLEFNSNEEEVVMDDKPFTVPIRAQTCRAVVIGVERHVTCIKGTPYGVARLQIIDGPDAGRTLGYYYFSGSIRAIDAADVGLPVSNEAFAQGIGVGMEVEITIAHVAGPQQILWEVERLVRATQTQPGRE